MAAVRRSPTSPKSITSPIPFGPSLQIWIKRQNGCNTHPTYIASHLPTLPHHTSHMIHLTLHTLPKCFEPVLSSASPKLRPLRPRITRFSSRSAPYAILLDLRSVSHGRCFPSNFQISNSVSLRTRPHLVRAHLVLPVLSPQEEACAIPKTEA